MDLKLKCNIFDLLYDILGLSIALKQEWKTIALYTSRWNLGNSTMLERYNLKISLNSIDKND